MSVSEDHTREIQALMVKAVDGLLDDQERRQLDQLCAGNPSLAEELKSMTEIRTTVKQFGIRDPNPGDWEGMEQRLLPRSVRLTGWVLMLAGYLILLGTGLWVLFANPEESLGVKVGTGAVVLGLGVLFSYIGHGFLKERRDDPYKNIIR